jgi:hypothetical protein
MKTKPTFPVSRRVFAPIYNRDCPTCGAGRGFYCTSSSGKMLAGKTHRARDLSLPAHAPGPIKNLRDWWTSMRPYEGQFAKPRPAGLVVP